MKNAIIKSVGSRSRVSVPKSMTENFDVTQSIYVVRNGANSIALTQFANATKKARAKQIDEALGIVNPYSNGEIQFCVNQYFKDQKPESVVCFKDKQDNIVIHCLD